MLLSGQACEKVSVPVFLSAYAQIGDVTFDQKKRLARLAKCPGSKRKEKGGKGWCQIWKAPHELWSAGGRHIH